MTKRMHRQKVVTVVTAALFLAVLIGTVTASVVASQLYNANEPNMGLIALVSAVAFGILAIAAGWTLFYRLGGLITERRRSKVR